MSEYVVDVTGLESGDYAIAREEIVRCRDCIYYVEKWNRKFMCTTIYCDWLDGAHVEPDGFCAWGERRSE